MRNTLRVSSLKFLSLFTLEDHFVAVVQQLALQYFLYVARMYVHLFCTILVSGDRLTVVAVRNQLEVVWMSGEDVVVLPGAGGLAGPVTDQGLLLPVAQEAGAQRHLCGVGQGVQLQGQAGLGRGRGDPLVVESASVEKLA